MEATKDLVKEIDLSQEFTGTIIAGIITMSNDDIEITRKELEVKNTILFPGEIFIGNMAHLEIKVLAFIHKSKKSLLEQIAKEDFQGKEGTADWKSSNKLSRNITMAKTFLDHLIKNHFDITATNMTFDFRKDFQIIAKIVESYHGGEEDE